MTTALGHIDELTEPQWSSLEAIAERFEAAWRRGERPDIADHLPEHGVLRQAVLVELVHSDLEFRLADGEAARVEDYLTRFPRLGADPGILGGLVAAEMRCRSRREPGLTRLEYLARFPELGAVNSPEAPASRPPFAIDPVPLTRGRLTGLARLGRFELLGEIGRGAFGIVYRARDTGLDRVVALKVPRPSERVLPEEAARLQREARNAAGLMHPNIVAVYEVGEVESTPYLAVELVEGSDLATRMGEGPIAPEYAAEVLAVAAEAVDFAHRRGVIHRDLKPSNLLLDAEGAPHVADFGLAKSGSARSSWSEDGRVLGTPAYMSPEQARGESDRVDGRSDVYSLGAILYQMLVGAVPFPGLPRLVLEQVLRDEPRPPRSIEDRVPRDLEVICLKAMAKDPARRYETAGELAADLRRYLRREPILARPAGVVERTMRWARRRPSMAALAGLTAIVAAAGFAGVAWQWRRAEANRDRAETSLYFHLIARAQGELQDNDPDRAADFLAGCPERQRGWEWHYLMRQCRSASPEFLGHEGIVFDVAASPDGALLATAGGDRSVRLWDLQTGLVRRVMEGHDAPVHAVAFSPAGDLLASASGDGTVRLWGVSSGRQVRILRGHADLVRDVAFSPDGARLASVGDDQVVRVWDVATGAMILAMEGHSARIGGVAFSPDGRTIVTASGDGTVRLWDSIAGHEARILPGERVTAHNGVAISHDGRCVAAAGADGVVRLWGLDAGDEPRRLRGHPGVVLGVAFSPDGQRLASAGADGSVRLWHLRSGQELLALRGRAYVVWSVAFGPSGRRLASAGGGGSVRLWDASLPQEEPTKQSRTLRADAGIARDVAFRFGGRELAAASGGAVQVWDVLSGREVARVQGHAGAVYAVAFSPDGTRMASGASDGTVTLWDATRRESTARLRTQPLSAVAALAYTPDGTRLAAGGANGLVTIWDTTSLESVGTIRAHRGTVTSVAYDPMGRRLATAGRDGRACVWDAEAGTLLASHENRDVALAAVAFRPDGLTLALAAEDGTIRLIDPRDGSSSRVLSGIQGRSAWDVAFSPDGRHLVAAIGDAAKIWELGSDREAACLRGHEGSVYAIAFSPDGECIASAGRDRTVRVWPFRPDDAP